MKLAQVLEQHKSFCEKEALSHNLGDGYLCKHNKIYKVIRRQTLKLGYEFSEESNAAFLVLPFAQLEKIFTTHKIPWIDNVTPLEEISQPLQQVIDWSEIEMGYKRNYLFHESCHAVARELIKKDGIASLLLEESFANTCELFAMSEAQTKAHELFYSVNSYSCAFEDGPRLREVIKNLGFDMTFKFTVLAYFHSNFLYSRFSASEFKKTIQLVFKQDLKKRDEQQLQFLAQMAFSLDEAFKFTTRSLHFKLHGYSEAQFQALRKDYLPQEISILLDSMVKVFYT